ncbi:uncharacterized protein LOC119682080 [Teleopsis dalmanni]|uniref:uncharacterized protein LOC119682080 n=1 Tax=Teleopsis dalmanni TaxID=139649 RepID=UPI0018CC974D|nr:uncharacterized protein LOC119682080 [Teleopsis dalmanni]
MENIEGKLNEYRLRQRRKERFKKFGDAVKSFIISAVTKEGDVEEKQSRILIEDDEENKPLLHPQTKNNNQRLIKNNVMYDNDSGEVESESEFESNIPETEIESESKYFKYFKIIVYILFWVTLYAIAIELGFGIVFLIISALVGMYLNTRTSPKHSKELSAYSVFNENCKGIEGSLTAAQFEREMGYRT